MKRNLKFLIVAVFLIVVLLVFNITRKKLPGIEHIAFRGKIINMQKQYRGRYDIEVTVNGKKNIFIINYAFSDYANLIKANDSLIKLSGSNCFIFKRNENVITEQCTNFIKVEGM